MWALWSEISRDKNSEMSAEMVCTSGAKAYANVSGQVGRGRRRGAFVDQIRYVLK